MEREMFTSSRKNPWNTVYFQFLYLCYMGWLICCEVYIKKTPTPINPPGPHPATRVKLSSFIRPCLVLIFEIDKLLLFVSKSPLTRLLYSWIYTVSLTIFISLQKINHVGKRKFRKASIARHAKSQNPHSSGNIAKNFCQGMDCGVSFFAIK